ncbi:hypothetical protein [Nonomuraea aurantiaca]|uniref:hypothetical protein n=1 Tax=Nonomuraea aurantiaca TaxID=2878562 RepID=UPI001CD95BA4|nr:hypothetical protein [Nonomuraea aurantiaca]MCA2229914.1 hypothetical protein [Nonomuraea aurantiaca]
MSPSLAAELGVRRLLIAAGQAPSVHNTQPWRFAVSGKEISLPRRSPLPAIDRSTGCEPDRRYNACWVVATARGLSASFLNQPLDLRDMRHRRDPRHRRGHPQMIIRLGYGPYGARPPRRPAGELETHHA